MSSFDLPPKLPKDEQQLQILKEWQQFVARHIGMSDEPELAKTAYNELTSGNGGLIDTISPVMSIIDQKKAKEGLAEIRVPAGSVIVDTSIKDDDDLARYKIVLREFTAMLFMVDAYRHIAGISPLGPTNPFFMIPYKTERSPIRDDD